MGHVARSSLLFCLLAGVATAALPSLDLKPVATTLTNLVAIADAGDNSGRLFLVEQSGRIKIFDGTKLLPAVFLNLNSLIAVSSEQGLLGLTFHPGYSTNGLF